MPVKEYKQTQVLDPLTNNFQSNVREWTLQFGPIEILQGRLLKDLTVTTAQTEIVHGLNRKINGWILVSVDTDTRVWEIARTETTLTLDTSSNAIISLWVF